MTTCFKRHHIENNENRVGHLMPVLARMRESLMHYSKKEPIGPVYGCGESRPLLEHGLCQQQPT